MALDFPALPEADVREADGEPCEDGGEGGEREKPVEGVFLEVAVCACEEGEETEGGGKGDGDKRATLAVNVGKYTRCLVLLRESCEGTRGTVDGGVANGKHRDHDDGVEDRGESFYSSVLDGNDKR